jgi:hypothetical protein
MRWLTAATVAATALAAAAGTTAAEHGGVRSAVRSALLGDMDGASTPRTRTPTTRTPNPTAAPSLRNCPKWQGTGNW